MLIGAVASCKKNDSSPAPKATCTIVINDTLTVTPDSIHYDYYVPGNVPRMQAFTGSVAVFTLWPGSFTMGSVALSRQYVYWIYKTGIYSPENSSPGLLQLTNNGDVLSGSFSASGTVYSGTGPASGKITAMFANVREVAK